MVIPAFPSKKVIILALSALWVNELLQCLISNHFCGCHKIIAWRPSRLLTDREYEINLAEDVWQDSVKVYVEIITLINQSRTEEILFNSHIPSAIFFLYMKVCVGEEGLCCSLSETKVLSFHCIVFLKTRIMCHYWLIMETWQL